MDNKQRCNIEITEPIQSRVIQHVINNAQSSSVDIATPPTDIHTHRRLCLHQTTIATSLLGNPMCISNCHYPPSDMQSVRDSWDSCKTKPHTQTSLSDAAATALFHRLVMSFTAAVMCSDLAGDCDRMLAEYDSFSMSEQRGYNWRVNAYTTQHKLYFRRMQTTTQSQISCHFYNL